MISQIHHLGIGVEDIEAQVPVYQGAGFRIINEAKYEGIGRCVMLESGTARVELFQFDDPSSELARKINNHTAFATNDLEADLQYFLGHGYVLAIPIDDGDYVKRYAYVEDPAGNFIELCELR